MAEDINNERRIGWARATADIAVIKEIQLQQTAMLAKLGGKLDLLWDQYQRDQGALNNQQRGNLRWRWILSTVVAIISTVLAYRIETHP